MARRSSSVAAHIETRKTFCRFCLSCCSMDVDVDARTGEALALHGDPSNVLSGGYTCLRGRELITIQQHPDRITGALKRSKDGFEPIAMEQALDEIAERVKGVIDRHGARSIATYNGSWAWSNLVTLPLSRAFHKAIGSPSMFAPTTLDQPAKAFMPSRFGVWLGGIHTFSDADVAMFIGNNPVLSQYAPPGGLPPYNPSRRLQDALDRGLKLIVIDPRKTEVARKATLHLQLRPGEDPTLLAAMLKLILDKSWHDRAFCAGYVEGLERLHEALSEFTVDYAAKRCGLAATDIETAAEMFASLPKGAASTGTGPEMAPRGNLTEHLVMTLNTVCGRYYREGESLRTAPPLSRPRRPRAQVAFPPLAWGEQKAQSRFRGLGQLNDELPCNVMADEILTPGEGQIRALFVVGGNPVVAFPNQQKVAQALEDLDLLVAIDPWMSATSKRADYIIGPKVMLERADASLLGELYFEEAYAHYTPAIVKPRGEAIEEWEFVWELSKRLGIRLNVHGLDIPMDQRPSKYEITELLTRGSSIALAEVKERTEHSGGQIFPEARQVVMAAKEGADARFQLAPSEVIAELAVVAAEQLDSNGVLKGLDEYPLRLTSRRIKQFFNSSGHNLPNLQLKGTTNFAHMNPLDMDALGLSDGQLVSITSPSGDIAGVVKAEEAIREGVVSMAHAFGDTDSNESNVALQGASTNRLVSDESDFDPITGQARQSAIPVRVQPLPP